MPGWLLGVALAGAPADLVLRGGVVHTLAGPDVEAVAVTDGRISWIGSTREARAHVGPDTVVVRLRGRTVLPGLIDAHDHLLWSGAELRDVDLFEASTVDALLAAVRAGAAGKAPDAWVRGGGWDLSAFDGLLDRTQLDVAAGGRPVYLSSADAHSAWVSTAALRLAGVDATTVDPPGGRIERDAAGEPTGVLREAAADLVGQVLPEYPDAQADAGLADACALASSVGITTIIDPAVEPWILRGYQRALDAGTLCVRVRGAVVVDPETWEADLAHAIALREAYPGGMLAVNAVKLFVDGVIETGTARMLAPYADGTNGAVLYDDETLRAIVAGAAKAGLQVHAHAIGDGAVRQVLDAVQWLQDTEGPGDRRPILAHLEVIDPADVPRFAELGAIADFQPLWAYPDPYVVDLTLPKIGDRGAWLYPIGAVARAGGALAAGSDWSVSSMDPFEGMAVAVTRQDPEAPGDVLGPEHAVSPETILRAYTVGGAWATFLDGEIGTIAVGRSADLVVVDRDPLAEADLTRVRVVGTWLAGRRTFGR